MSEPPRLSPFLGRPAASKGKKLPPTLLQPDEVEALLAACDQGPEAMRTRNRALIMLLYRTGTTIGEALALRLADIDLPGRSIHIDGGGNLAKRTLGMDESLHGMLVTWLDRRRALDLSGDRLLCNTGYGPGERLKGGPLSPPAVRHMLRVLCPRAGLGETRVHPQAFRHSFAAELIGEGWPLPYIQRQLGITTFRNIDTLLNNLGLPQPADDEVMAVVRTRVWDGL